MAVVATYIILAVMTVYFCLDRGHRIDRNGIGRGLFYSFLPFLAASAVCTNLMSLPERLEASGIFPNLFGIAVQFIAVLAVNVLSLLGSASVVKHETDNTHSIYSPERFTKMAVVTSVLGAVSGAAAAGFCCTTSMITSDNVASGILTMLVLTVAVTLLTFGIGLAIMTLVIPIYSIASGAEALVHCIPPALSAFVWGGVFFLLHVLTAVYGVLALLTLFNSGRIDKRSAVKYGIIYVIPGVNVFALIRLLKKQ